MFWVFWGICGLYTVWLWRTADEQLKPGEAFLTGVFGPIALAFTVAASLLSRWHRKGLTAPEPDISYDPLDDEFKALEAQVADRERRKAIADAEARDYNSSMIGLGGFFAGWQEGTAQRQQHEALMAHLQQRRYVDSNQFQNQAQYMYWDYRNDMLGNLTACDLAQGSLVSQKVNIPTP